MLFSEGRVCNEKATCKKPCGNSVEMVESEGS